MNAFDSGRLVEARGMAVLEPFLRQRSDGRFVLVEKGPLKEFLQRTVGDALLNVSSALVSVEIKIEEENRHGNFFLETWSNKNLSDRTHHAGHGSSPGWMMTNRADWLLYYFLREDDLYVIDFFRLKRWAFAHANGRPRIDAFPERCQQKRSQLNDTWGRCVPIGAVESELGRACSLFHPATHVVVK